MRAKVLLIIFLINLFFSLKVFAEEQIPQQALDLAQEAEQKYNSRDYIGSIEKLQQARLIYPLPLFLYNIARCYEKLDNNCEALRYYREYLVEETNLSQQDISEIESKISDLNSECGIEETNNQNTNNISSNSSNIQITSNNDRSSNLMNLISYIGMGVGSVFSIIGIGLWAQVLSWDSDFENLDSQRCENQDDCYTYSSVGDGFLYSGLITLGASVFLWLFEKYTESEN